MSAKIVTLRPRGRLSDVEREQRRTAEREFVQQAVEALRSSDGWQRWLASRRHFHSYSLLISGLVCREQLYRAPQPSATCH